MRMQISSPFAFVLMPFASEFNEIYRRGIKRACDEAGVECERVDEQFFTTNIIERVYDQIARADVIVADMTGANPNVYYEAGYARALGKPIIFVSQENDIPFDLKHYPHILYGGDVHFLRARLREYVIRSLAQSSTARLSTLQLEFHIMNRSSAMCLDVARVPNDHPYRVHHTPLRGAETQIWRLHSVGRGYYRIVCVATGKCLSVDANGLKSGASIIQWDYFATPSQHWMIRSARDGTHQFVNEHSGKCLEVPDPDREPGTGIVQWTWHGAERQSWWLLIPATLELAENA